MAHARRSPIPRGLITAASTALTASELVNENGEYEQTTDRNFLVKYFVIERLSDERDYYGQKKRGLGRIRLVARLNGPRS